MAIEQREQLKQLLRSKGSTGNKLSPLSFAQQRVWFLHSLNSSGRAYNITYSIRCLGHLDVSLFKNVLNEVVNRHEVLRTKFVGVNGKPVQMVLPQIDVEVPLLDMERMDEVEAQEALSKAVKNASYTDFDLSQVPLLRASVIRLSANEYRIVLVFHHIVFDAWSSVNLMKEIRALYQSAEDGEPAVLPDVTWQYSDYVSWERSWSQSADFEQKLQNLKTKLGGAPELLPLPTDRPRPAVQSYSGAYHPISIPQHLTEKLKMLAKKHQATLYMVLLSAFNTLLYRYTGQHDLLVGTPVSGRDRTETEPLIGFFVNTIVIRTFCEGNLSFAELLCQVRQEVLEAFSNGDVPFERIVEELHLERNLSYNPLFQVMFTLNKAVMEPLMLTGATLYPEVIANGGSKFDLSLLLDESDENGVSGYFEYSTDLFDAATLTRMSEHYLVLLESIVNNPEQSIDYLPILTEQERQWLLTDRLSLSTAGRKVTLQELFEAQAAQHPTKIAAVCEGHSLTYQELNERANQLAHRLIKLGVGPEKRVGICVDRSLDMLVGIFGILKAGGVYVPIDPAYPVERRTYTLGDSQASVLLTQSNLPNRLQLTEIPMIDLDTDWGDIQKEPSGNPAQQTVPDNAAYVIYTSGSTGKPKGVVIPHQNVVRLFDSTEQWFHFNENDVWTLFHSFAFDFSVWEIFGALCFGGRLVVVPYQDSRAPEAFYDLLCREQVTVLNQTPTAFQQLIRADEKNIGSEKRLALRTIIFGGEALEFESLRPWMERHGDQSPQLVNMYGITETTVHVTYRRITIEDLEKGKQSNIGVAIPDLQVYILNEKREPVPIGVPGEIYVGGAGVAREYLYRPELNSERFLAHPFIEQTGARLYKTGDLGRYLADGSLEYLGRIDHQVKIRGFRIELGEIDAALISHPAIDAATVVVRDDLESGKRLVAFLVATSGQAHDTRLIRNHLKKLLPSHMIPSVFVWLEQMPYTVNGKVDRAELGRFQLNVETELRPSEGTVPRDHFEFDMQQLWQDVLKRFSIDLKDNFFEIGGHSLALLQLQAKIQKKFGKEIPLTELFQQATIEEMARLVRRGTEFTRQPTVLPMSGKKSQPSIFLIHQVGGYCFRYRHLARLLGEVCSVYGLQVSDPNGDFTSLFEMAAYYIREIKKVDPEGPYYLAGHSIGGTVAFEMGVQLQQAGEQVGCIVLLDTFAELFTAEIEKVGELDLILEYVKDRFDLTMDQVEEISTRIGQDRVQYILDIGKAANYYRVDMDVVQLSRVLNIYVKHMTAMATYQKPTVSFEGDVLFFRAEKEKKNSSIGWEEMLSKPMELVVLPEADHYTVIEEPHVQVVAAAILQKMKG